MGSHPHDNRCLTVLVVLLLCIEWSLLLSFSQILFLAQVPCDQYRRVCLNLQVCSLVTVHTTNASVFVSNYDKPVELA